jgi:hypothetical protein
MVWALPVHQARHARRTVIPAAGGREFAKVWLDLNRWVRTLAPASKEKDRNTDLLSDFEIAAVGHVLVANQTRGSGRYRD